MQNEQQSKNSNYCVHCTTLTQVAVLLGHNLPGYKNEFMSSRFRHTVYQKMECFYGYLKDIKSQIVNVQIRILIFFFCFLFLCCLLFILSSQFYISEFSLVERKICSNATYATVNISKLEVLDIPGPNPPFSIQATQPHPPNILNHHLQKIFTIYTYFS